MDNEEQPAAELSKEERIERHFTTTNEHWNKYTFGIYSSVTDSGIFDDVEVSLDAFSYATNLLLKGRNSPLSAVKDLMSVYDEQTDPIFTYEQKRFMLTQLIRYHEDTIFIGQDKKEYSLTQIVTLLRKQREKLPRPDEDKTYRYDWQETKRYLDTLPDTTAKIAHLLEQKTNYKQSFGGLRIKGFGPDYDEQCQTEIKKLRALNELEQQGQLLKSPFKISGKKGAKINLIRVLNALYELRLIELENGQLPNKEQFMQLMGSSLGVDLSAYQNDLKQAFKQSIEVNSKIFEDLKSVTITDWQSRQDRDL